ncbi:MAG: hypothetical protein WC654_06695, partial [Patescibacteria group bacterium]
WALLDSNTTVGLNISSNFSAVFGSGDIGNWTAKFNATDGGSTVETGEINFTVERDDTQTQHFDGNASNVSRIGSNSTFLRARVTDTDKASNNVAGQESRVWATKSAGAFNESIALYTNSTGYVNYNFNPDCTFQVGNQKWIAGLTDASALYKPSNSSQLDVFIYSLFYLTMQRPLGTIFVKGADSIALRANLTDSGGCGLVNGSTVKFVINNGYVCSAADEGNGSYSCTIPASTHNSWAYGWHNVTVNVTRAYYNDTFINYNNSFYLASKPQLSSANHQSATNGWGAQHSFSVTVTDLDDNNVSVRLWKKVGSGGYELKGTKYCQPCSSTQLDFNVPTTCSDVGTNDYFFNASDEYNQTSNTTEKSFSITKDSVVLEVTSGIGEAIGREGEQSKLFALTVLDTDKGDYVPSGVNGSFFVTVNGTGFASPYNTTTNSSGFLNYDFNATCEHSVGSQKWQAGVYDGCYAQTSTSNYSFDVFGQLRQALASPTFGSVFNAGEAVNITFKLSSDCGSEGLISGATTNVSLNPPIGAPTYCSSITDNGNGWYNCTWPGSAVSGQWDVLINSTKTGYYFNYSEYLDWFNLTNSAPNYENATVTPGVGGWTRNYSFMLNVSDIEGDDVNCSLWISKDAGSSWQFKANQTIAGGNGTCAFTLSSSTFSCSDIGTDNQFLFSLQDLDDFGNAFHDFNTTAVGGPNLTASTVQLFYGQGNNSNVNRSGNAMTRLSVKVYDSENNSFVSSGYSAKLWVTTNGADFDAGTSNTTNASGFAIFDFNPSCSYSAGVQNWTIGMADSCYQEANSSLYNTTINGSFFSALFTPSGQEILQGQNVTIRINASNDCNQPMASATVNLSASRLSTTYYCSSIENETTGAYNCSLNTSAMNAGQYNVTVRLLQKYYNTNATIYQNKFFVETTPSLSGEQLNTSAYDGNAGPSGGFSETFNFTVNVSDPDGDAVTARLYIKKAGGNWQFAGSRSCTNCANTALFVEKSNFGCGDIASWQYLWNATEDDVWNATTSVRDFDVEKDDVEIQYFAGNESYVWRNSTGSAVLSTVVWDTDRNAPVSPSEAGGKRWVTVNGTNWDSGASLTSDTGGFFNSSFDPSCSYSVGLQHWKMGTTGNSCLKDANSSLLDLTIQAPLSVAVNSPNGSTYQRGSQVPVAFNISDECNNGVAAATTSLFFFGPSNYFVDTGISDYGNGTYDYSFDTTGKTYGYYNVTASSAKTRYSDANGSKQNAFIVASGPEIQLPSSNLSLAGWGEEWGFSVECRDEEADQFNVSLWVKYNASSPWYEIERKTCQGAQFQAKSFQKRFDCGQITPSGDNAVYKFNATDQWGYTAQTAESQVTIEKDDVGVQYRLGNNENVDREGDGALLLRLALFDQD